MKNQSKQRSWREASTGNHQGLIVDEQTGANIAVAYDKADAPLIALAPQLLAEVETLRGQLEAARASDANQVKATLAMQFERDMARGEVGNLIRAINGLLGSIRDTGDFCPWPEGSEEYMHWSRVAHVAANCSLCRARVAIGKAEDLLAGVKSEPAKPEDDALRSACIDLLDIVEAELADDPEPEDLPSWKRAIEAARKALGE